MTALEGVLRDLYALAAFYTAHPEHPLPDSIVLYHHTDEATVQNIADAYSRPVYPVCADVPQTHHSLSGTKIPVQLLVSVPTGKAI